MVHCPAGAISRACTVACAALAGSGLFACHEHRSQPADGGAPSASEVGWPPSPLQGGTVACQSDADCPVLACGPCDPGKVITKDMLDGPECYRNPCIHTGPYCNPDHLCAIHPKTEWNQRGSRPDAGAAPASTCSCIPGDPLCEMHCAPKEH